MPSRYARARIAPDDPKVLTRKRYMQAISAGATIANATAYANGEIEHFTPASAFVAEPVIEKHRLAPTPGEGAQLLPGKVVGDALPPPKDSKAVDPDTESIKRPMSAPPAPVSKPAAISASVETKPTAETPATPRPTLPDDWENPDVCGWQQLRGLSMALKLPAPVNRKEAIKAIKAALAPAASGTHEQEQAAA
jgi:hypothetical protein